MFLHRTYRPVVALLLLRPALLPTYVPYTILCMDASLLRPFCHIDGTLRLLLALAVLPVLDDMMKLHVPMLRL